MGGKKVCRLRFEKKSKNFIQKIYFKGSNFLNDLRVLALEAGQKYFLNWKHLLFIGDLLCSHLKQT